MPTAGTEHIKFKECMLRYSFLLPCNLVMADILIHEIEESCGILTCGFDPDPVAYWEISEVVLVH